MCDIGCFEFMRDNDIIIERRHWPPWEAKKLLSKHTHVLLSYYLFINIHFLCLFIYLL